MSGMTIETLEINDEVWEGKYIYEGLTQGKSPVYRFIRWEGPDEALCPSCKGGRSEWKKRKNGEYDRRYRWPIGPCLDCEGTGYTKEYRDLGLPHPGDNE